jgi:uncharacterized protein with PIN domain
MDQVVGDMRFNGRCLACNSSDLDYDIIEPVDEFVQQKITCNKCGKLFVIWSNLKWEYAPEDLDIKPSDKRLIQWD